MIKLNCGISRKVGEANFGSRGASVNVEMELETSIADPQQFHDHVRRLFSMAKAAVEEELGLSSPPPAEAKPIQTSPPANDRPSNGTSSPSRPATGAQIRAIKAICDRLGLDIDQEIHSRFGCRQDELSLPDASSMIDQLKALKPITDSRHQAAAGREHTNGEISP